MDPKWRAGGGGGRGYPSADDIKYKHAPFRPSPTAGKPMKGDFSRGAPPMAGAGPAPATVPASGAHAPGGRQAGSRVAPGGQRGSHFQQRHQFEQTMATVTAQMDDALMSEAARCQQLEDELKLLREDMYLEKATNNDLKAELRELRRVNETLQQERSQNYGTIGTLGTQKQFLQEDHQQLLHEIQVLRASEERLNRQVQRLSDENGELRSYWEDGFSELKAQRTASINDQMLADAARKGEAARAQRREKILLAEKEHATNMLAESQRGHFTQLGRVIGENSHLQNELQQSTVERERYLQLLQGATGGRPAAPNDYTSYDFVDLIRDESGNAAASLPFAWQ